MQSRGLSRAVHGGRDAQDCVWRFRLVLLTIACKDDSRVVAICFWLKEGGRDSWFSGHFLIFLFMGFFFFRIYFGVLVEVFNEYDVDEDLCGLFFFFLDFSLNCGCYYFLL
ncbi:unnamed protein product [Vicia faba]|uniref:Transmembrane protein n=1 Tax=Vicia faba TaxID=3906 RepID=A0AAV0ZGD6_VICFA|nr:unnamed protein product [Vicia faba]